METPFVTKVARVCHEANRAYCQTLGDDSQPPWDQAPAWQQQSAVEGVKFRLENPNAPASAQHEKWLEHKKKEGWKYGLEKNPATKEHPCMVPYAELPPEQRTKDRIFGAIVGAMRAQA